MEDRVQRLETFEDKIKIMEDTNHVDKEESAEFRSRIITEVSKAFVMNEKTNQLLKKFKEEY